MDIKLPGSEASPFPFFVMEEISYSSHVPVLISTNVLRKTLDELVDTHGVRFS